MVEYWPISDKIVNCFGPNGRFRAPASALLKIVYIREVPVKNFSIIIDCIHNGDGENCNKSKLECMYHKMSSSKLKDKFFPEIKIYREGVVPLKN